MNAIIFCNLKKRYFKINWQFFLKAANEQVDRPYFFTKKGQNVQRLNGPIALIIHIVFLQSIVP